MIERQFDSSLELGDQLPVEIAQKAPSAMKKRLIQTASWIVVVAIFLHILAGIVPPNEAHNLTFLGRVHAALLLLAGAIKGANIPAVLGLLVGYMVFLIFLDSYGTYWVFKRFNCDLDFKEIIPARIVTFLLAVFNYQVGQLGLPLYLKRLHNVPLLEGMGSVGFLAAVDLLIVLLIGTSGAIFLQGEQAALGKQILFFGAVGITIFILNAIFWRVKKISEPLIHHMHRLPLLNRIEKEKNLFSAFQKARLKDYLKVIVIRLPIHLAILTSLYLMIGFFGAHVPLDKVFIYLPVVMIVSTMPLINVGGLGASQASVVYFFKPFAPEATLLAVSLVWALGINLMKVGLGAAFLTKYSAKLFRAD